MGVFVLFAGILLGGARGAQDFRSLTPAEAETLDRHEAVIRIAKNANTLGMPDDAPNSTELRSALKTLKPNYVVEVFRILPSGSPNPLKTLAAALSNPESWVGIPYHSERKNRVYDLFSVSKITSKRERDGDLVVEARHLMDPFEAYEADYEIKSGSDWLVFTGTTTSPLIYKGVKAVSPGSFRWIVLAWKKGGEWYFYGVSAVSAFDLFGAARSRLEPSFVGRTRAFLEFALSSIDK